MYRDMAVLSMALMLLAPLGLYAADASSNSIWIAAVVFIAQYLLTAISARHSGERLVCNVLAVHSNKRIMKPKVTTAV